MRARRPSGLALVFAAITAVLITSTTAAGSAIAAPTATGVTVTGGQTTTVSTPEIGKALLAAGIVPLPVGKATLDSLDLKTLSLTVTMPIVGGSLDPAAFFAGNIDHTGGLTFINVFKARSVTVSDFVVINDATPRLVATVNKNAKQTVTLFNLDLSALELTGGTGELGLGNVGLTVTEEGAALLNQKLRTTVFKAGAKFGTADTTVLYQ